MFGGVAAVGEATSDPRSENWCAKGGDDAHDGQHQDDEDAGQDQEQARRLRVWSTAGRVRRRRRSCTGGAAAVSQAAGSRTRRRAHGRGAAAASGACAGSDRGRSRSRIRASGSPCGSMHLMLPSQGVEWVVSAPCPNCRIARSYCVAARPGWSNPTTPSWSPRRLPSPPRVRPWSEPPMSDSMPRSGPGSTTSPATCRRCKWARSSARPGSARWSSRGVTLSPSATWSPRCPASRST